MTDLTKAREALADRLETFASSLWSSPWSSRDAVLVLEAVEMLRSPIAASSPALEPDDEAASLLERLRNPQWVHGSVPFESPQLDKEQTVADMAEAAWMIDALCNAIEIERRAAPSGEPVTVEASEIRHLCEWILGYLAKEGGLILGDVSEADRLNVANAIMLIRLTHTDTPARL